MSKIHDLAECNDAITGPAIEQEQAAIDTKVLRLPEHNYMPADGTAFNKAGYVVIPAVGAEAIVLSFVVPAGRNGVILWVANNFVGGGFVDGSGSILWRFTQDDVPLVGLETLNTSLGSPANPSRTSPIRIIEGKTIKLVVRNVSVVVNAQLIGGRLSGHFYPKNTEQLSAFY